MNKAVECDVLVIGSGIAGLTSALQLAKSGVRVTVVTREKKPEESNTLWAQGGIIFSPEEARDRQALFNDILRASANTAYRPAVDHLAATSGEVVRQILLNEVGVPFEKNGDKLLATKEAAHSRARIIYKGDYTGRAIQLSLLRTLQQNYADRVEFLTEHTSIDLITPGHHGKDIQQRCEPHAVLGAFVYDQRQDCVKKLLAKKTILASGGISALYLHHTNSQGARGDGHAMASRAGARLVNMEFVQFHPTTFYAKGEHRRFLMSEALRGEGGTLLNQQGQRFMPARHQDAELAPRDVVSRAIVDEMLKDKSDCVYLDMTHLSQSRLSERFPTIFAHCLEHKIDISRDYIPVVPAAHYSCGGIQVDLHGRTNLENLYAVGEVSCTGVHGANRLASTSLLEGLTWGYFAAEHVLSSIHDCSSYSPERLRDWEPGLEQVDLSLVSQDWSVLRQTMWNYVGIKRSKNRLGRARAMLSELGEEVGKFYRHAKLHDNLIGLRNAVDVSQMVLDASRKNMSSVGCFYLE